MTATSATSETPVVLTVMRDTEITGRAWPALLGRETADDPWEFEVALTAEVVGGLIVAEINRLITEHTDPETGDIFHGYPAAGGPDRVAAAAAVAAMNWQQHVTTRLLAESGPMDGIWHRGYLHLSAANGTDLNRALESLEEMFTADLRVAVRVATLGAGR